MEDKTELNEQDSAIVYELLKQPRENQKLRELLNNPAVHFSHCYQGEYANTCKYGDDDCPAFTEYSEDDELIIAVAAGIRHATPLAFLNFKDTDKYADTEEYAMRALAKGAIDAMKKFQDNYKGKHEEGA